MRCTSFLILPALCALLQSVAAQQPDAPVRLTTESPFSQRLVGTLVHQDSDSLWVQFAGHAAPVGVARSAVTRLEIDRHQKREVVKGAGVGLGVGLIGGFVFGALRAGQSRSCATPGAFDVCYVEWYGRAFRDGVIGGAIGGVLGAALGYAVKTNDWQVVPLGEARHLSLAPRGAGVAISLTF